MRQADFSFIAALVLCTPPPFPFPFVPFIVLRCCCSCCKCAFHIFHAQFTAQTCDRDTRTLPAAPPAQCRLAHVSNFIRKIHFALFSTCFFTSVWFFIHLFLQLFCPLVSALTLCRLNVQSGAFAKCFFRILFIPPLRLSRFYS